MRRLSIVIVIGLAAGLAMADQNDLINPDRPGIADGSFVVGKHFQIETGFQYESHDAKHTNLWFMPTLLRFGVDSEFEIRVEGNGSSIEDSYGQEFKGYQPFSIGAKLHFIDAKGTSRPSLAFIGRVFPVNGSGGFQSDQTTGDLRLAADWNLNDKWELNPNIGIARYEDGNGNVFAAGLFALTLNYNPTPALDLFLDTGIQTPEGLHGQTAAVVDAGVAYIVGKNLQLDLSVGNGVSGQSAPRPFVGAGVSYRF